MWLVALVGAGCATDDGGAAAPSESAAATTETASAVDAAGGDVAAAGSGGQAEGIVGSGCSWATEGTGAEIGDPLPLVASLSDCELNPTTLHELACGFDVTVVSVGAGWCQACIDETPMLIAELFRPHAAEGLQVVQVLTEQVQPGLPATSALCREWTAEFGVPYPVVIDPTFGSEVLFPGTDRTLPLTLIVDGGGVIRHSWAGFSLEAVKAAANDLLRR